MDSNSPGGRAVKTVSVSSLLIVGICLGMLAAGCSEGDRAQRFEVVGSAMAPSFPHGTMVDVEEYGIDEPQRGDVVVFRSPDDADLRFIKRIIGVPGDLVEIRDGIVHVNGTALDEPYKWDPVVCPCGPWHIEQGHYFVLTDNRSKTSDSRTMGQIPEDNIIGRVVEADE
jgi:signal peptidase I